MALAQQACFSGDSLMQLDERLRSSEQPMKRIILVWLILCAMLIAASFKNIVDGSFPDPDDALRLTQIRDLLAGQSWFDLHQYRINPPDGTLMHWSRLVDAPVALLILMFEPIVGQPLAERIAMVTIPLLTFLAILTAIGRLTWRLFDLETATMACVAAAFLAMMAFQIQPMRIDHHGWQIFSVALALWAISWRNPVSGGLTAGLSMAAGMIISLEILPMAAAFGAVLALRWLWSPKKHLWLVSYMQALAVGLVGLFLATRGVSDLFQHCDAISPAHLGLFVIAAVGVSGAALKPAMPRPLLALALGASGLCGIAFFAPNAPQCLASPFANLDPLVLEYWHANVLEGRPLWDQSPSYILPTFFQMLVALAVTLHLRARASGWLRDWWTDYALLLAGSIILSVFVARSFAFASVIAALPLGWLAITILRAMRKSKQPKNRIGLAVALILIIMPSTPVSFVKMAMPKTLSKQVLQIEESACMLRESGLVLNQLEPGTIFAPLDIGPALLVTSDHSVVATGHHRAKDAMHDVILAYISRADEARVIMREHKADYVVFCTDLAEPRLFAKTHPSGFAAQLIKGDVPNWLVPVELDVPDELKVWRITDGDQAR